MDEMMAEPVLGGENSNEAQQIHHINPEHANLHIFEI